MRLIFLFSSFTLLLQIHAQPTLQWAQEVWASPSGNLSAHVTDLTPINNFIPENSIKSYFQRYKCKWSTTDKSNTIWKSEPVVVNEVSNTPMVIFYSIQKAADTSKIRIAFQSNTNSNETPTAEVSIAIDKLLKSLSNRMIFDFYGDKMEKQSAIITDTQNLVKAAEKDIQEINKSIQKSQKDIQDSKGKISEAERKLSQDRSDEISKKQVIESEKAFLASNNPEVLQNQVKELAAENKRMLAENEKSNKSIIDKKMEIQTAESQKSTLQAQIVKNDQTTVEIKAKKAAEITSGGDQAMIKERMKLLDSQMKDIENENKKILKDVQKQDQLLVKYNTEIDNLNSAINNNKLSVYQKEREIQTLNDRISASNLVQRAKDLKDKENELSKLQDQISKTIKTIDEQKLSISTNETSIQENKSKLTIAENVLQDRKKSEKNQVQILEVLKEKQAKFAQP